MKIYIWNIFKDISKWHCLNISNKQKNYDNGDAAVVPSPSDLWLELYHHNKMMLLIIIVIKQSCGAELSWKKGREQMQEALSRSFQLIRR